MMRTHDVMPMSSSSKVNHDDVVFMMTSCQVIPMWDEWNVNADDFMMMWLTLFVNLVMSCLACTLHASVHGTHALIYFMPK